MCRRTKWCKYIQEFMTLPQDEIAAGSAMTLAQRQWGGDTPLARAALLRWGALNLAFQDKRLETWTVARERDRIQVPAALVAAAGVAPLVMDNERAVFDIPALLDATLRVPAARGSGVSADGRVAAYPAPLARFGMLRTIALYKLLKVIILLLAAWGEVRLHDATLAARILSWAVGPPARTRARSGDAGDRLVQRALRVASPQVRLITLTYAAVFAVEGIGLWMQRRWAEWLTMIITASLVPLELWELIHRPSIGASLVLLANCLIVGYLILARVDAPKPAPPLLDKAPPEGS